jgi:hypothetical protein
MKKNLMRAGLACTLLLSNNVYTESAVTYLSTKKWGGRLGDMLLMYTKAKWVAYHYDLPLLYKPFTYSDALALHDRNLHYQEGFKEIEGKDLSIFKDFKPQDSIIYTVHYYFQLAHWGDYQKKYDSQEIMAWPEIYTDPLFISELKKDIAPRDGNTISLDLPTDKITVAVHIRSGGGFDNPLLSRQFYSRKDINRDEVHPNEGKSWRQRVAYADWHWPLKFPPLKYYATQLKRLSRLYKDKPMYVYIYTDNKDPVELMHEIERVVNRPNITFDCRKDINRHNKNVLEDMFAIAQYQCLIRSGSNYPQVSQLIGNHKVVIYPKSAIWIGNTLVINEVGTFVRDGIL